MIYLEMNKIQLASNCLRKVILLNYNNNNNGNYNNKQIEFNTLNISNKMINYSNSYIEL